MGFVWCTSSILPLFIDGKRVLYIYKLLYKFTAIHFRLHFWSQIKRETCQVRSQFRVHIHERNKDFFPRISAISTLDARVYGPFVSPALFLSYIRMKRNCQLHEGSSQASLILRQHCLLIKHCYQELELASGMEHFHVSHYVICHL